MVEIVDGDKKLKHSLKEYDRLIKTFIKRI